jgi:hypothetical protein
MKTMLTSLIRQWLTTFSYLAIAIFFLAVSNSNGQTIITPGTAIKVVSGSSMTVNNQLTLQSGAMLTNDGTVILKDNLANQALSASSLGGGAFVLSGSAGQTVSGQNVIQNLTINNGAGVTVAGNTFVNGTLTLSSGVTSLGNFNLVLGIGATVSGSPSSTNMIAANGSGQLQKQFSGFGSFTFPVGDATGAAEYSPVTLAFNSGAFGSGNNAGVNLVDAQHPGTSTSYLTRYWNVTQSGITDFSCNATFQYPVADVVGTEGNVFLFKVGPSMPLWTAYNAANTSTHQITAHGLSALGTFTGNLGNAATPPPNRSLQDKTITSGMSACADATLTMLIAGNGTTYTVQNGGSVNHIAGHNIIYYPGTRVELGGYLHAYISTVFCDPYVQPIVTAPIAAGVPEGPVNGLFRIYPNPTTGLFTLEMKGLSGSAQANIEICGILGNSLLDKDIMLDRKQEFSLADKPVGVYVIHVTCGGISETAKIIKR